MSAEDEVPEGFQGRVTGLIIPPDAVLVGEIAIVAYMDAEGKEMWAASPGRDSMPQTKIIGLLELTKHAFLGDGE